MRHNTMHWSTYISLGDVTQKTVQDYTYWVSAFSVHLTIIRHTSRLMRSEVVTHLTSDYNKSYTKVINILSSMETIPLHRG